MVRSIDLDDYVDLIVCLVAKVIVYRSLYGFTHKLVSFVIAVYLKF